MGGADGAQGVVLVHDGDAEDGHHGVADELLHRAAVRLHDPLHPLEVPGQHDTKTFRVDRLAERGRARQVAEHHRDDSPLLVRRRCCWFEAALGTEPERPHRVEAAVCAAWHAGSVGRDRPEDEARKW